MATEAAVNPNTMQRALANLEAEGLLYTQRTSGRFVTEDEGKVMEIKKNLADNLIREFLEKMEKLGYTPNETIGLINQKAEEETP